VFCAPVFAFGQSNLHGTVTDARTNEAVAGVMITNAADGKLLTTTNAKGKFSFKADSVKTIRLSMIGFAEKPTRSTVTQSVEIALEPSTIDLQQVVVSASASARQGRMHPSPSVK
jgi:iron complex outermembrane receptor protein